MYLPATCVVLLVVFLSSFPHKTNVSDSNKQRKQFSSFACATGFKCFWLATNLKVLQLKMEMCSSRNMAVRVLRCEFKGFCGDAALPHCCDRRAFLLAFIFSRRFTRWLLVISISSTLSKAVRSCGGAEEDNTVNILPHQVCALG